jgi:hypothetical protein
VYLVIAQSAKALGDETLRRAVESVAAADQVAGTWVAPPLGRCSPHNLSRSWFVQLTRAIASEHLARNPGLRQRFEREAPAVSSLNDPTSACCTTSNTRTAPTDREGLLSPDPYIPS